MKGTGLKSIHQAYMDFFGLKKRPFAITPDPEFYFESSSHKKALVHMEYTITEKMGFAMVTGEVGTGKTLIARIFMEKMRPKINSALILHPILTERELLYSIVQDLGLRMDKKRPTKKELLDKISSFILSSAENGKRTVIIIDEAQDLKPNILESLRLISNLETGKEKLLDIILLGQPELEKKLSRYTLRQLNQRILVRTRLNPLQEEEIEAYLDMRIQKSGGEKFYDSSIIPLVYRYSKGIPRLINAVMERALIAAFVDDSKILKKRHLKLAHASLLGE